MQEKKINIKKSKLHINQLFDAILNSYSQVFFGKNKIFASILLIVSFLDPWMGVAGLVSILTANITSYFMGFSLENVKNGIYGFNPLLVGLGVSIYFAPQWEVLILIILAALLTLFISFVLEGMLKKYALPFLSLPFLLSIWLLSISFSQFHNFGLNAKDIYLANELYAIGGLKLVKAYEWLNAVPFPESLKTYFLSIGAIFFNFNLFAGILISIGLLIHSRIAFIMSFVGFYAAYGFYHFLGTPYESLSYTFYGFNFILSAIAIGSYFLIPSFKTLIWTVLLIPILVLITIGTDKFLSLFRLPVYSLPFNMVVLGFVYSLKLRTVHKEGLTEPPIQKKKPEFNVYFYKNWQLKNNPKFTIKMSLPVFGKWSINQGFNGEITHKDLWRFAWDFVITDANNKEFRNDGLELEDYYCYNKNVVAPADGTVVEIIEGIEDNLIGDVNLIQNWGNTVIIMHGYGLYSQMSHLKSDSIKVYKGMFIKKGQHIANVGNSGRSPYPHLHFQFQTTPIVGSHTIKYPFANYILNKNNTSALKRNSFPQKNDIISNIEPSFILKSILNFVPGTKYEFKYVSGQKEKTTEFTADADIFNNTFLQTKNKKSVFYFKIADNIFEGIDFKGQKSSPLFVLFQTLYSISFEQNKNILVNDNLPVHFSHNKYLLILQDFFATIGLFLKTEYKSEFIEVDDDFNPTQIELKSVIKNKFFNKIINQTEYKILLSTNNFSSIEYTHKNKKISILWQKKQ